MPINVPYRAQEAGVPGQWNDQINPVREGLIVGETPGVVTVDLPIAANQELPAFTPVIYAESGYLVAATGGEEAIGITLLPMVSGASPILGAPILIQGCLNKDMLNWHAAYDTDAKKFNAFRGAPTPTSICWWATSPRCPLCWACCGTCRKTPRGLRSSRSPTRRRRRCSRSATWSRSWRRR